MKRFILSILLFASMALACMGCGSNKEVDVTALANDLNSTIAYQDELNELNSDSAAMVFNFGEAGISEMKIYESNGGTAEEIVVVKCADADSAASVETALKERVEEQKESFEDYVPAELEKLEVAVVYKNGNYAVLSVSNEPDKAREIIDSYFK